MLAQAGHRAREGFPARRCPCNRQPRTWRIQPVRVTTAHTSARPRRIVTMAVLGVLLTVLVAGCGSSSNTTSSSTAASTPETTSSAASTPASTSTGGSSSSSSSSSGGESLSLEADKEGQLKYDKTSL